LGHWIGTHIIELGVAVLALLFVVVWGRKYGFIRKKR
jgi:hypothetical protein